MSEMAGISSSEIYGEGEAFQALGRMMYGHVDDVRQFRALSPGRVEDQNPNGRPGLGTLRWHRQ